MTSTINRKLDDYMELRTIPAFIGIAFVVASAYQFGALTTVELAWLDYTLTAEHATLFSLAAFAMAFMSSETRQFRYYEDWEKAVIASGPAVIVLHQYSQWVANIFTNNDPTLAMVAFFLTVVSWGVAVR